MSSSWTDRQPARPVKTAADGRPESPCVRNCCLDDLDICLGCGRSLNEILEWSAASDERRLAICADAGARLSGRRVQP